jgi:hypothetical protein
MMSKAKTSPAETPEAPEATRYRVLSPLQHDTDTYAFGAIIVLPPGATVDALLVAGVVEVATDAAAL